MAVTSKQVLITVQGTVSVSINALEGILGREPSGLEIEEEAVKYVQNHFALPLVSPMENLSIKAQVVQRGRAPGE